MLRFEVERIFNQELKDKLYTKPDVLKFILNHERKTKCIDNVCREVKHAEKHLRSLKPKDFRDMIKSVAVFFGKTALDQREQHMLSDLEKNRITKEANYIEDAKESIADLDKWNEDDRTKIYQSSVLKASSRNAKAEAQD